MSTEDKEKVAGNAELDALEGHAAAMDAEYLSSSAGPELDAQAMPPENKTAETAAMFGAAVAMLSPVLPYLPGIYTPETVNRLAEVYQPVADKYGWDVGGWLAGYGAELALIGTAVPLIAATAAAHKAHVAAKEAERVEKKPEEGKPVAVVMPAAVVDNGGQLKPAGSA